MPAADALATCEEEWMDRAIAKRAALLSGNGGLRMQQP